LAECGRALGRPGLIGLGGHVSLRIPDSELILITPRGGLDKLRMRPSDLTTIDAAGKPLGGPYPPPIETPIHTVVHAVRPGLASVAHLHPHWATIFSVLDEPLEVVLLPAACLGGPLPTFDEPHLVTTPERRAPERCLGTGYRHPHALARRHRRGRDAGGDVHQGSQPGGQRPPVWEARHRQAAAARRCGSRQRHGQPDGRRPHPSYHVNLERPLDQQRHMGSSAE
jgi:hypothetical protein